MPQPRKPTALKLLDGNPGQRRILEEPKPSRGLPTCPSWLLPEAKREWRRLGPELERLGLMTVADRAAFAAYCQAWARWVQFERAVEGEPDEALGKTLAGQQRAFQMMTSMLVKFGLSPADRARLSAAPAEPDKERGIAGLLD